jgi:cobalamin biosynthesis protein CbiD
MRNKKLIIVKTQRHQAEVKLNGTHQLLAYADVVELLGDNTDTTNKTTGIREVNAKKTKYMLLSDHHNVQQDLDIQTGNQSFENVAQLKYLGRTITNQNLIQKQIKWRLNLIYA